MVFAAASFNAGSSVLVEVHCRIENVVGNKYCETQPEAHPIINSGICVRVMVQSPQQFVPYTTYEHSQLS